MIKVARIATIVKVNAGYRCQECGSDEIVQSHHQIPGDDSSQICLCAECHSLEHPEVPKGLFFSIIHQPYWFNKPASRLAREVGVISRTIIRAAKKLDIPQGELSIADEALIIGHLQITQRRIRYPDKDAIRRQWGEANPRFDMAKVERRKLTCKICGYQWYSRVRYPLSCPNPDCRSPFWNRKRRRKVK